jgi:hypothetical protein
LVRLVVVRGGGGRAAGAWVFGGGRDRGLATAGLAAQFFFGFGFGFLFPQAAH